MWPRLSASALCTMITWICLGLCFVFLECFGIRAPGHALRGDPFGLCLAQGRYSIFLDPPDGGAGPSGALRRCLLSEPLGTVSSGRGGTCLLYWNGSWVHLGLCQKLVRPFVADEIGV